jgi:hypothetical protein
MALYAATGAIKISFPGFGVPRLKILYIHAAAPPGCRLRLGLRVMDEGDNGSYFRCGQREGGHSFTGPARPDRRPDLVAAHVFGYERGACKVRSGLAALGVAAMAEAAQRDESGFAGLNLTGGVRLGRAGRGWPPRGRALAGCRPAALLGMCV